jgi:predicted dehydrogenase
MIRCAVWIEDSICREIAPRLRGATVETWPCGDIEYGCGDVTQFFMIPNSCDAAAFFDQSPLEPNFIERCIKAGKHVLLTTHACPPSPIWEAPSGVLEALSVTAKQAGVQLAVVNPDRGLPSRQLIKQQLDAGKLGDSGLVRLHHWGPASADSCLSPLGIPAPLVHDLDSVLWLTGKTPDLVYASEQTANERHDSPGRFVQVHLGFPGGGMALIDYTDRLPPGDGYQSLSVIGSAGAAYADDHQNTQLLYRGGRPLAVRADDGVKQLAALLQEFVDDLQTGRDLSASVTAWRDVLTVADAVRRSLESRQAIPLEGR